MKKLILSAAAILAFGFANAQEAKFGVKGGVNFANLGGDVEDAKMIVGFHVGGFAELMVSDKFAIQPELLFSMQGAKQEYEESGADIESTLKLSYLNVPIMAKYYVTEGFNIQAGPQIGFLMSAKEEFDASGGGITVSGEEDVKEFMETIDFGLNVGVGYNFGENFGVEARYNIGMSNIAKDSDDYKMTNSVIQLSLGYRF